MKQDPGVHQHPLRILQQFSFSADLPLYNSLQWSQSNRLIGLNIHQKLIIFQVNINFATSASTVNHKQWIKENLKFVVATIEPPSGFVFNVGPLEDSDCRQQRQGYLKHPKKPLADFKYFNFSPASTAADYNLIAAITDDFCLLLYLQLKAHQWQLVHNLSTDLNTHYIQNKWDNLHEDSIDFAQYCQRLDALSTTSFCWHPHCHLGEQSVQFRIYSGTKSGDICLLDISLSCSEDSKPKCESKVVRIVATQLKEIVTLKLLGESCLLAESADGRSLLFEVQEDYSITEKVLLWPDKDDLPCYNFCFTPLEDGAAEIVFHKVDTIIRARLSADLRLESCSRYPLAEDTELLAVYHYGDRGQYCASQYNSSKIWSIRFPEDSNSAAVLLHDDIKFANHPFGANVSVYGFDCSTNGALMAFVSSNNSFCSESHVLKNVEIIFCTRMDADSLCRLLTASLVSMTATSTPCSLLDCLYLFRYFLFTETNSDSLKQLLHFVMQHFRQIDQSVDGFGDHLLLLKILCYILRRYRELSSEEFLLESNTSEEMDKMLIHLERCIRRCSIEQILTMILADTTANTAITSLLTCEQLVSLCNINRHTAINGVPKEVIEQVEQVVCSKNQLEDLRSSFGFDYSPSSSSLNRSKSLMDQMNRCPFCEKILPFVGPDSNCPQHHPLDICANSLLVVDPMQNDVDLCEGCLESKLLKPRVWPSPTMSPFSYAYNRCLFCF